MARYQFDYDEITCCTNCPILNIEFGYCPFGDDSAFDDERLYQQELTVSGDGKRPDWCKLTEVEQDG